MMLSTVMYSCTHVGNGWGMSEPYWRSDGMAREQGTCALATGCHAGGGLGWGHHPHTLIGYLLAAGGTGWGHHPHTLSPHTPCCTNLIVLGHAGCERRYGCHLHLVNVLQLSRFGAAAAAAPLEPPRHGLQERGRDVWGTGPRWWWCVQRRSGGQGRG